MTCDTRAQRPGGCTSWRQQKPRPVAATHASLLRVVVARRTRPALCASGWDDDLMMKGWADVFDSRRRTPGAIRRYTQFRWHLRNALSRNRPGRTGDLALASEKLPLFCPIHDKYSKGRINSPSGRCTMGACRLHLETAFAYRAAAGSVIVYTAAIWPFPLRTAQRGG